MQKRNIIYVVIGLIIIAVAVVVVVLVVRHDNSVNNKNVQTAQTNAAISQIKSNWQAFFAASTGQAQRQKLLQNGSQFSQAIQQEFTALGAQKTSVTISSVKLNGSSAAVVYTVSLNGQPVLNNQNGSAVRVNNVWLVSDATFCQLLGMGGSAPSFCQNIK